MWLACETQADIAAAVNVDRTTVTKAIDIYVKNRKVADFHTDFTPPLDDIWSWAKMSTDGVAHPGNSHSGIVENLLWLYTDVFDIVVDPFAGGGSTIDVCKRRGRRYYASDLTPIAERDDIRRHNILDGLPAVPRWGDVKLVYLDPPYWKQAAGMYGDSPHNLANLDAAFFHSALGEVVRRFLGALTQGAKVALLIQNTHWNAPDRKVIDHVLALASEVGRPVHRRFYCPYSTEQSTPQMVNWARENRSPLVRQRELLVWEA